MNSKKRIFRRIRNSAIIKNPVLFEAVGLCPVVAIALSLRLALFLAVITAVEMILTEVFASLLLKNVKRYWRVAIYVLLGTGILYPIMFVAKKFFPDLTANFGIYLPLMAVNSLVALHCERVAVKNTVLESFADAVSASVSYDVVVVVVGITREILANGTLGGFDLHLPVKLNAFLMPFGGLIIIGFTAAFMKGIISKVYPDKSPDRAFDTSEIHRSLKGTVKELLSYDFNPYGDEAEAEAPALKKEQKEKSKKKKRKKAEKDSSPEKQQELLVSNTDSLITEEKEALPLHKKKEEKPKKQRKPKKSKAKTQKDKKNDESFISVVPTNHGRNEDEPTGRTYLDDFSDMLSDLEAYKKNDSDSEEDKGGDEK